MPDRDRKLPTTIRVATGSAALAAAFGAGVLSAGAFTQAPTMVDDTVTPVAGKDALHRFDDCRELLDWYIEENVGDVGAYGWQKSFDVTGGGGWPGTARLDAATDSAEVPVSGEAAAPGSGEQHNSKTGTNVQEVGVDEPDVAKTDGRLLVHLVDNRRVVVTDVAGPAPRRLGTFELPTPVHGQELLLVGEHVLVTTSGPVKVLPTDTWRDEGYRFPPGEQTSQVLDLDISDPGRPRLLGTDTYSGQLLSVRQYGDVVRVVTSTPRPELDWVQAGGDTSEREAARLNRELVRNSTLADWLPRVTDDAGESVSPECDQVLRPRVDTGSGTVAVFGHRVDDPAGREVTAVVTDSQLVYSSTDRLYVATTRSANGFWRSAYSRITGEPVPPDSRAASTQLHGFALRGTGAEYAASGHVRGTVKDRWSLDEQDGRLRVAVSLPGEWGGTAENAVTVLAEKDAHLREVGHVDGLGPDEEIKSVRWFDDFAVVVTFRQTDPLYTIDFSDPDHPVALGELKILGFSGYLHPIGGGLLLGLGQDATGQGQLLGAQAAVFDISDLSDPRRVALHTFDPGTHLAAMQDPRAFTWLPGAQPGSGTAVTTLGDWRRGEALPTVLRIRDGRLHPELLWKHADPGGSQRALPLEDGRIALVDRDVELLDLG